jgi:hypothetical protein
MSATSEDLRAAMADAQHCLSYASMLLDRCQSPGLDFKANYPDKWQSQFDERKAALSEQIDKTRFWIEEFGEVYQRVSRPVEIGSVQAPSYHHAALAYAKLVLEHATESERLAQLTMPPRQLEFWNRQLEFERSKSARENAVLAKEDDTAYRPAKEFIKADDFPRTLRELKATLDECPWIKRRRPPSKKTGKPNPHRLEVHAGDWHKFLATRIAKPDDPTEQNAAAVDALLDAEKRKQEARARKIQNRSNLD